MSVGKDIRIGQSGMYVEPNEKRTHTWLTSNGSNCRCLVSSMDSLKLLNHRIRVKSGTALKKQDNENVNLSIDEVLDFIEREEKQKKTKRGTPTTEYFSSMKEMR